MRHPHRPPWSSNPKPVPSAPLAVAPADSSRPPREGPRLLARVRQAIQTRHYSRRTEKVYVGWVRRYVLFHRKQHPALMGSAEISSFLSDLATRGKVSASTQNQALSALLFLYRDVLGREVPWMTDLVRAKVRRRLPVVLTREEVALVLSDMSGTPRLMATLLYGAGLRLLECCQLRVKDVDLGRGEILVRSGKGGRDRVTMLPTLLKVPLTEHLERIRRRHAGEMRHGLGWVVLPGGLERKYPNAGQDWAWQWVFPAARTYVEEETGQRRRHHVHESVLQRAVREAVRVSRIAKAASCHTFRHSFATHLLEGVAKLPGGLAGSEAPSAWVPG